MRLFSGFLGTLLEAEVAAVVLVVGEAVTDFLMVRGRRKGREVEVAVSASGSELDAGPMEKETWEGALEEEDGERRGFPVRGAAEKGGSWAGTVCGVERVKMSIIPYAPQSSARFSYPQTTFSSGQMVVTDCWMNE